jgi:HPt (histidine-containing phosphotransfer) domain-containing protein
MKKIYAMTDIDNNIAVLTKLCNSSPESIRVPSHIDEKSLLEFVRSTRSTLERLEEEILFFELFKVHAAVLYSPSRLLHRIKEEASSVGIPEICNVCLRTQCLLGECHLVPIETLRYVKDWLWQATEHLAASASKPAQRGTQKRDKVQE